MNVYTTFEWLGDSREHAQWATETFDVESEPKQRGGSDTPVSSVATQQDRREIIPIQMCLHVEYIPPVEEITCNIEVGEVEQ